MGSDHGWMPRETLQTQILLITRRLNSLARPRAVAVDGFLVRFVLLVPRQVFQLKTQGSVGCSDVEDQEHHRTSCVHVSRARCEREVVQLLTRYVSVCFISRMRSAASPMRTAPPGCAAARNTHFRHCHSMPGRLISSRMCGEWHFWW